MLRYADVMMTCTHSPQRQKKQSEKKTHRKRQKERKKEKRVVQPWCQPHRPTRMHLLCVSLVIPTQIQKPMVNGDCCCTLAAPVLTNKTCRYIWKWPITSVCKMGGRRKLVAGCGCFGETLKINPSPFQHLQTRSVNCLP